MNEQALMFSSISISSVSKRKLETKLEELQVSPTKKLKQALESIPTVLNKKSNEIEVGEEFEKVVKEFSDFRSKVSLFLFFSDFKRFANYTNWNIYCISCLAIHLFNNY